MKYYRNFFSQLKIYVTTPMSCISKPTTYVTLISNFFIVNEFFAYPTNVTSLKLFVFFFSHDKSFVKVFFYYFFSVVILFKNCFNKFRSSIFTSKNNYWVGKFIINSNKLVSKTTRNVIINFSTFKIILKVSINFKWNWCLFKIVFKLDCSFF